MRRAHCENSICKKKVSCFNIDQCARFIVKIQSAKKRVEPGSGISNASGNASAMSMPSSDMENGFVRDISTTDEAAPYQHKTKHENLSVPHSEHQTPNSSVANVGKPDATMYHSILDMTEIESSSDSKDKDANRSRTSIGLNFSAFEPNATASTHKRKRIRRKKISKQAETSLYELIDHHKKTNFNKPKIVDSYTLPCGKHIRFDSADNGNASATDNATKSLTDPSPKINPSANSLPFKTSKGLNDLSSLLALRNCSSPITFVNKKAKYGNVNGSDLQTENDDTIQSSIPPNDTPSLLSSACGSVNNIAQIIDQQSSYSNVKPEEYPCLESATEINDVIAFKVLRMGSGYTPEVSGYIVAKTLAWCPKKQLYTFQILRGQAEIKGPSGKFSLQEDEDENDKSDTAEFNFAQLIEPRLINRK